MSAKPLFQSRFEALNCCVIVPTYNNERTLASVITGLKAYTHNIIVVNDGSTDATSEILAKLPEITFFNKATNQGKGTALKKGFETP